MPLITSLIPIFLIAAGTQAKDFPASPTSTLVADNANLLNRKELDRVSAICRTVRPRVGALMVVVTLNSLSEYGAQPSQFEQFSKELYNSFGIGSKTNNRGAMLLVVKTERKVRIELGAGWKKDLEADTKRILQQDIVPRFKANDYPGGILAGATSLRDLLIRRNR